MENNKQNFSKIRLKDYPVLWGIIIVWFISFVLNAILSPASIGDKSSIWFMANFIIGIGIMMCAIVIGIIKTKNRNNFIWRLVLCILSFAAWVYLLIDIFFH